ncbi:MAG: hypothetical protein NVS1B9_05800 [Solirubrobacteraceae bacterium]
MSSSWHAVRATAMLVACAALIGGCGLGAGLTPASVGLTVTRDFGRRQVAGFPRPKVGGSDTVMRLLQRNASVATRYGGGFVQSIDGLSGGGQVDWFYYVNGVEAAKGAAATRLRAGDHVNWDLHYWGAAADVRAIVGAFPEPFMHGIGGTRLPVRIECEQPSSPACAVVSHTLTRLGIPAARGGLALAEYNDVLRVLVGGWARLRTDVAALALERGPRASGVYARIAVSPRGTTITTLDDHGNARQTLGAGSGLVAATRYRDQPPVWIVTGTDPAGIASAARAFEAPGALGDSFALAIAQDRGIPLPSS